MRKSNFTVLTVSVLFLIIASGSLYASGSQSARQTGGSQDLSNLNPKGQLPIVKQQESFTLLADDAHSPTKTMYEIWEKETNVRANLQIYPTAAARERKNILLASGDYPDAMGGWLALDVAQLAGEEVIIPLEKIIEEWCPNILEALNLPGVRAEMTLPDGHIYSPPYPIEEPYVTFNPWINTKWLAQLGLQMPTTTEEFKQVLIAFRDRISEVAGQKIIPLAWNPNQLSLGIMAGYFGLNAADTFVVINGQLEIAINRPEYKAFLKWFADLYANNLVDKELFTQDYAQFVAKGKQGLYGAAYSYYPEDYAPPVSEDITKNRFDYEALPVLKAPGVTNPVWKRFTNGVTLFRNQMVITNKAKNPITILRWLDNIYSMENSLQALYGPIGLRFEKLANGTYREKDTSSWSQDQKNKYSDNNNTIWSLPKFMRADVVPIAPPPGKQASYDPKVVSDEVYKPYMEAERLRSLWLSPEDNTRIAEIGQSLGNYMNQRVAEWVSGQANIDAEWDQYVAELNRLGIQDWLQIQRKYYK
jgi:putative aldouronate transport system substrate-binding protein